MTSHASPTPESTLGDALRDWGALWVSAWNRFWFTPAQPHTLCLLRILTGWMLLYTHAVWTIGLNDFLGPYAWIDRHTARDLSGPFFTWSPT